MDEKTAELRDIFTDLADEGTVTESQTDKRGSLTDRDERDINERIEAVIERMRERYDFRTDCSTADLRRVARGFYDGESDATIADALDTDPDTVFAARMDLHLLDEGDADFPFDLDRLRDRRDAGEDDPDRLADELGTDPATVARALRVLETQAAIRRVSHRFQSEFEDAIPNAALSIELTSAAQEDGLREAAEDIETDTQL